MAKSLRHYINLLKFSLLFKKFLKSKDDKNIDMLTALALEERGILYKILQNMYPEKIPAQKIQGKALSKNKIIPIIEKDLNIIFNDHFSQLSEPIFCASIGQVHKAELKSGQQVAIKIQYPDVKKSIQSQINFLKLAAISSKFSHIAKWQFFTNEHIQQIDSRLTEELNYQHELSNLQISQSFNLDLTNNPIMAIKAYCSSQILTQTWIEGFDLHFIQKNWNETKKKIVVELIVARFLKQIFVDGFFQGDTNISNFLIQDKSPDNDYLNVHWIDFGNWCHLSPNVQQSLFTLILQAINNEDINYLDHFEKIGFDLSKLQYFQNLIPCLVSILFEPFLINRPYPLDTWQLEERIDSLLGKNKWWFRSSGNSQFLELMKSFFGIVAIVKMLKININWQKQFLLYANQFDIKKINLALPIYLNKIPTQGEMAKNLIIHIFKNSVEHVRIELPATTVFDLENCMPEEVKIKLIEKLIDLQKIKFDYLENGLIPGVLFNLETEEFANTPNSVLTKFQVYLI